MSLGTWTRATAGIGGFEITTVEDGVSPGADRVSVRVSQNGNASVFLRLVSGSQ